MKKLIAVILAVLLLGSAVACAEAAPAVDLKDPVLDVTAAGETVHLDLSGLTLRFGVLGAEEDPCLVLNVLADDTLLVTAAVRQAGGQMLFAADGFSHSYALPVTGSSPAMPGSDADGEGAELSALYASLMEKIMSKAEIGMEGDAITFRLPYTAVNELLRELVPLMGSSPNAAELLEALEEMEAKEESVELSGSVSLSDGVHAELNVTPVRGGEPQSEDVFRLLFDLEKPEGGVDFTLSGFAPSTGDEPVFRMVGSFRSGEQGTTAHCDVFADAAAISAGAPSLVLDFAAGEDVAFTLSAPESFLFEARYAREAGTLVLSAETASFQAKLMASVASGEAELQSCTFPEDVIALGGELSEEAQSAFMQDLQAAVLPLLGFVMRAAASAGLLG